MAFNFYIVNFPHIDSKYPSKPAYGLSLNCLEWCTHVYLIAYSQNITKETKSFVVHVAQPKEVVQSLASPVRRTSTKAVRNISLDAPQATPSFSFFHANSGSTCELTSGA